MSRFFPKSVGGQLAALLVAALLTAHLVTLLLFWGERDRAVAVAVRLGVVERIAALVEVIDDASPDLGTRLAKALSSRGTRLAIEADSSLPASSMTDTEQDFARDLADELSLGAAEPRVRFVENPRREPDRGPRRRRITDVTISIPLKDGQWLNASSVVRTPTIGWSWPWVISLIASATATLAVVALLVRRITGPMRSLAAAAEKLGRGEEVAPLASRGPTEIRATVDAFNAMQARLSRFVRDRTRMIAAISHDLRTPITSLRLRAEFIDDDDLKSDVIRTLDEMQSMTDATLAFVREESGGEETRSVDLAALIDGLVEDQISMGRDVTYSGPERLVWRGRPVSLKRAIINLVENAVRYAGAASVMLSRNGAEAMIVVDDNGPGIPPERLAACSSPSSALKHHAAGRPAASGWASPSPARLCRRMAVALRSKTGQRAG